MCNCAVRTPTAVTSIRIEGVLHEFSSLAGVREDIIDLVLNVKQIALRMEGDQPRRLALSATGPGEVTAGQIVTTESRGQLRAGYVPGTSLSRCRTLSRIGPHEASG